MREELEAVQQQLTKALEDLERERAEYTTTSQATADQVRSFACYLDSAFTAHDLSADVLSEED